MRSVLTILAGACCASLALAQPATRTETRSSTTTTAGFHRITTVVGTAFSLGNENVGKVVDVVFDNGGCIEYVLVQDTDGFVVVPWGVVTVNYDQKVVTVNSTTVTRDKLREVTFTEGRLPNFSDASFTQKMTTVWGERAGRSGRPGTGTPGAGTATPDRKGGTSNPPDRTNPGTTTPDRKGGTTPPDRTTPGSTTPPPASKPGTTTPRKDEPPAKDTPRTNPPKKEKDKDGKDGK
jgi:hypothetical protein